MNSTATKTQPLDVGTAAQADANILVRLDHTGTILTRRLIVEALERLPADVWEFALRLRWVSVGVDALGLAGRFDDGRGVVFLSDEVCRMHPQHAPSVIAHELAHHWLGHVGTGEGLGDAYTHEVEACAQVAAWGFTGWGASVDMQHGYLTGSIRDIFGQFPALAVTPKVDQFTQWEVGWLLRSESLWESLRATFTPEQHQIWEDLQHAQKQSNSCRLARSGFDTGNAIEPPIPN